MQQKTISQVTDFTGIGLHSGEEVHLTFKPAPAYHGVCFRRLDLPGEPVIPAHIQYLHHRQRRTALASDQAEIHTVEHLLATLYGLGIDNLEITIDGVELPGADGSAKPYLELLQQAGVVEQQVPRRIFQLEQPLSAYHKDAAIVALPSREGLRISYTLDYEPHFAVQTLYFKLAPQSFAAELAPARTFCLAQEARALQQAGLGKGANSQNTLVITEQGEVYQNTLRFTDEYVRHKVLDLLGDLFLCGVQLSAHIMAYKSGHELNAQLVRLICNAVEESKQRQAEESHSAKA